MKLIRLKLNSDFRSLKSGFDLTFRDLSRVERLREFEPFCFAGLNGSGKSNVLEALATIFYHLELCANRYKPESFKPYFDPADNRGGVDAFELEYLIFAKSVDDLDEGFNIIRVTKESNQPPEMKLKFIHEGIDSEEDEIPLLADEKEAAQGKAFLPDLVVGYSSGENEILSIPFLKSRLMRFDEYTQGIFGNEKYKLSESSLLYVNNEMSQAVLIACLIFEDDLTLTPLREELGIIDLRSFRLSLINNSLNPIDDKSEKKAEIETHFVLESISKTLNKLKNIATAWYDTGDGEPGDEDYTLSKEITLDFFIDSATKKAFKDVFRSGIEFYRFFQQLQELNLNFLSNWNKKNKYKLSVYQSRNVNTRSKLPVPGPDDRVFNFLDVYIQKRGGSGEIAKLLLKQFSDGEHQFLHTLGICLLLKQRRTLMLLDEPETHFNPDWRSKFINVLSKSIAAGGGNNLMQDVLLTSHSPFIISDCKKENVFVFRDGEVRHPAINTFGTSVNLIMDEVFGKDDTISDLAKKKIEDLRNLPQESLEDIQKIKEASRSVGESAEKVLLFRDLIVREDELEVANIRPPIQEDFDDDDDEDDEDDDDEDDDDEYEDEDFDETEGLELN